MGDLYNEISTTRTAAGKLWTASMSLDHIGNDWSVVGAAMGGVLQSETIAGVPSPAWGTRISFDMYFPSAWDFDDEFDTGLELRLGMDFYISAAAGDDGALRIQEGATNGTSATWTTGGVPQWTNASVITWTVGGLPTGKTTINVQALPNTSPDSFTYVRGLAGSERQSIYLEARVV